MIRKWLANRPNKWQRPPSRFGSLGDLAPVLIAFLLTLIGFYLAIGPSPFAGLKFMQPQPAASPAPNKNEAGALLFDARPVQQPAKPVANP